MSLSALPKIKIIIIFIGVFRFPFSRGNGKGNGVIWIREEEARAWCVNALSV